MSTRIEALSREDFRNFVSIQTRWMDNDVYGHVNNVVYYSYFDTAVNQWAIEGGFLDIGQSATIGVVVETGCTYFESVAFPEVLEVGVVVSRLGRSSVRYKVGLFRAGQPAICAQGHFTHVYVDRASRNPVPIPAGLRAALEVHLLTAPE